MSTEPRPKKLLEQVDDAIRLKVKAVRARKPEHLPTVLSRDEVRRILDKMSGVQKLMAQLLYGTGMRVFEGVQLRVKDIDFDQPVWPRTPSPASSIAGTPVKARCRKPSAKPRWPLASSNRSARTPFATPSPPTCSKRATTSALRKSSSATRTSARR